VLAGLDQRRTAGGWPEWLDTATAAKYLGCKVGAVRKLYERRKVPHYQDGPGAKVWLAAPS
jgi:excisionase family DNA binding protein